MPPDFPFWCSPCEQRWPNHAVSANTTPSFFGFATSSGQCLGCHGTPSTKGMVIHGLLLTTQSVHAGNSQAFGCGVVSIPIGNEFIRQIGSSSGPLVAIKYRMIKISSAVRYHTTRNIFYYVFGLWP
ncbi:hypothetical protein SCLCIDRAFT_482507 [Scleroderma citrinum Foug A]|uniref:Uncharacterized protein n=1 Tax=Scleroderma citrinum Foug A TaxID=1036808 RepID=A0A0C2YT66_9AGAM|nr:hypothetical protein SCLCIDRAFT_482507 [Scleroderma citrinum Foug A]